MKRVLRSIRHFFTSMGLVEQSQVVASTSVIVAMITIITIHFIAGKSFDWIDFIGVITVGVFGFMTVYFSLKYGRRLEEQQRELLALNMIAEAVNYSVELDYVLRSALVKVMDVMSADCGWIYLLENDRMVLKHSRGTTINILPEDNSFLKEDFKWAREFIIMSTLDAKIERTVSTQLVQDGLDAIISLPLEQQGVFAGALIIAGSEAGKFQTKKFTLIHAFCNQINVALKNASLFERLKQSERLYADLYEHSPDMYHSINQDGIIVSCNHTEVEKLGYSKEEIIGKHLVNLYPTHQKAHVQENIKKIFENGIELKGIEEQIQQRDGTLIDVSLNTSLVYDADGKPILARMVLRDITEKKKMEEKIIQTQKIDSLGSLAGGIAHSFNNILTSVLGAASIMSRKMKNEQRFKKYIDLIENASRRGASLTRQLLTFARKGKTNVKPIDLISVIDETLKMFEATTPKSISIKCTLTPESVIVNADESQIQQALLNLFLNAKDAMLDGGTLSIECKNVYFDEQKASEFPNGKPGHYVMVSVADTGVGIKSNIIPHIFEPFFTTKEEGKGTGLGLSVVYGIVLAHNGYITVDTKEGAGSVFTIFLPLLIDGLPYRQHITKKTELVGGKEWILLVEDEVSVGEVGIDLLQDLGYSVEIVSNGDEAMQKLNYTSHPFDLVIIDMNMPRIGGLATIEHIRKQFPNLKIIVCSGYSPAIFQDEKFFELIDDFISKPYEIEEFGATIRRVLDAKSKKYHN